MLNFMKILSVVAKFFHADGRRDTTKLIIAFCNFANAPNNAFLGDVAYCTCFSVILCRIVRYAGNYAANVQSIFVAIFTQNSQARSGRFLKHSVSVTEFLTSKFTACSEITFSSRPAFLYPVEI